MPESGVGDVTVRELRVVINWLGDGTYQVCCAPCGYESVCFGAYSGATAARRAHQSSARHRRLVEKAS